MLLLVLTLILLAVGCSGRGETWQRIQEEGVLRVGLDPTYPPFETADDGELRGIDVDLARALAEELGLEAQFTYFGFDGLYDALATEQVDVLISALVIRVEQTRDFAYSEPYFNAGQLLVTPRTEDSIREMADLEGRTLAVELGAEGHVIATQWGRRLAHLEITPLDTPQAALDAVGAGDADAALVDAISARIYFARNEQLHVAGEPVTVEPFAMVVRKEDERLLRNLNEALEQLETSGELEAIVKHWMAAPGLE
ncbi:MAG TPA: ABC transporter substrate-binding protein [Candidatus Sulfomarinibacteraceae bacterium]|nr:ABC transporter substrate-binding protein [Candidatus Sulfomarinibacteraceae bacterium]